MSALNHQLEHIKKLLNDKEAPILPQDIELDPTLLELHEQLVHLRQYVFAFSQGDLSHPIEMRGYIAGSLKSLQAHLQHLTWQVTQIEQGDFSHKVDFLGEFSQAFNSMAQKLNTTLTLLRLKEKTLIDLTTNLQTEVELRTEALTAMQESAANFQYMANHDPLTGALNRRSFMERLGSSMQKVFNLQQCCCIVMLDIDYFKNFNDTYGHVAGDAALKHVVAVIGHVLRGDDMLGRYGGEEFIFLLPRTDTIHGMKIAERVRKAIENNPVQVESQAIPITASLGLVSICQPESEPDDGIENFITERLKLADMALYQAKKQGRNRVVLVTQDMLEQLA